MTKTNWIGKKMVAPRMACDLYGLEPGAVVTIVGDLGRSAYGKGTVMVCHKGKEFPVYESKLRVPPGMKQTRPLP